MPLLVTFLPSISKKLCPKTQWKHFTRSKMTPFWRVTSTITLFNHFWAVYQHLRYFNSFNDTFGGNFTFYPHRTKPRNLEQLGKCFCGVFGHSSLGIKGEIITKSGIKGVKVAQMLVSGSKMVKMVIYDVIMTSPVKMTSFWNLQNAFVVSLGIVPWG